MIRSLESKRWSPHCFSFDACSFIQSIVREQGKDVFAKSQLPMKRSAKSVDVEIYPMLYGHGFNSLHKPVFVKIDQEASARIRMTDALLIPTVFAILLLLQANA